MNAAIAVQVHCPFCNAAQAVHEVGSYVCEFCLQSFSVQEARKEETRLTQEIEAWLQQRVGAAGLGSSSIDASSRAYIFQNKMLPDIRRDVDRALEVLGDYAQHPLVEDPIRARAEKAGQASPLLVLRKQILAFKNLRARLSSDHVTSFAMNVSDKEAVQRMDRQVADVLHLSNVVEACAIRSPDGYAAARRNLEHLAADVETTLTGESASQEGQRAFLAATLERFRSLANLCRIYESVASPNPVSGIDAAEQLLDLSQRLKSVATQIESSGYSPAETLPLMVGVQKGIAGCEALGRWLRAYAAMAGRSSAAFIPFAKEMGALVGAVPAEAVSDWVEACAEVTRARRGEVAVSVIDDFAWVSGWVERTRTKKVLGMFGANEDVTQVEEFMVPVWVADVSYSKSTGTVFKEGVEGSCVALVDACGATVDRVVILDEARAHLRGALSDQRALPGRPVALPRSTASVAHSVIQAAVRSNAQMLNPSVKVRGLAFLPAALARFSSKKGAREAVCCLDGSIPIDSATAQQLEAANDLKRRFG